MLSVYRVVTNDVLICALKYYYYCLFSGIEKDFFLWIMKNTKNKINPQFRLLRPTVPMLSEAANNGPWNFHYEKLVKILRILLKCYILETLENYINSDHKQ